MSEGIDGKVIIITGASSGLGEATAKHLSSQGARVVLGARRIDRIQHIAEQIQQSGGHALALATDVTDRLQVRDLVDRGVETFGQVDVMLNNAGLAPISLVEHLEVRDWDQMIDVNVKGVFYGVAAALPYMQRRKSGHIINVASVAAHAITPGTAIYSASKQAVRTFSEGLRKEVKPYNIRTTIVSPGAIATELPNAVRNLELAAAVTDGYKHALQPMSFARVIAFLISQPPEMDVNEIVFRPTSQSL